MNKALLSIVALALVSGSMLLTLSSRTDAQGGNPEPNLPYWAGPVEHPSEQDLTYKAMAITKNIRGLGTGKSFTLTYTFTLLVHFDAPTGPATLERTVKYQRLARLDQITRLSLRQNGDNFDLYDGAVLVRGSVLDDMPPGAQIQSTTLYGEVLPVSSQPLVVVGTLQVSGAEGHIEATRSWSGFKTNSGLD